MIELGYELRVAKEEVPKEARRALRALGRVEDRLTDALGELHAISDRVYPPALTVAGLARALKVLACRSRLRVDLDVPLTGRLAEPVELAVCDVVSEALADAEAHDDASFARVQVVVSAGTLNLIVAHDGTRRSTHVKGATTPALVDQVQVLGGEISATNPAGREASLVLRVPVDAT